MTPAVIVLWCVADNQPISLKEYARHRKTRGLRGGSTSAVTKAVAAGRLVTSVTLVDGRAKIRSAAEADAEWAANTLPTGRREPASEARAAGAGQPAAADQADDDAIDFAKARKLHEIERWKLARARREEAELDLAAKRGLLVNAVEIRALVSEDYTRVKGLLRGVPTKYRQRVPTVTGEAMAILVELVDEALEELADEDRADGPERG